MKAVVVAVAGARRVRGTGGRGTIDQRLGTIDSGASHLARAGNGSANRRESGRADARNSGGDIIKRRVALRGEPAASSTAAHAANSAAGRSDGTQSVARRHER